jgi:hypothetical protein
MKKIGAAVMAIAALALVSLASLGAVGTRDAHAATWTIEGFATGAEEVPAVNTPGRAFVRFVFNDVTNTLTYAVTQSGFSADQVTAAHIHRGARGVNGPVVHNLSLVGFVQVAGTINLSAADVADLRAGNYYFNIHSSANPGGYARMQLMLPAAAMGPTPGGAITRPAGPAMPVSPPRTGSGGFNGYSDALLPLLFVLAFSMSGTAVFAVARRRS